MDFLPVIIAIASLIAGIALGFLLRKLITRKELQSSENLSVRIVEEAKKEADSIKKEAILQAKESLLKTKAESEREARERKTELDKLEARLRSKEENQEKRIDMMVQKESNIENREKGLQQK
ncbi:MAG TPA: Rnase Y domain-containing protein, partial [Syntrophales bacterium]